MRKLDFEARGVSKNFGVVQALKDVSLGVAAGEVHAVIGENGAGKTTLMNLFCGRLTPSSGSLCRNGQPITFSSPIDAQHAGIAIAPQEVNLVPGLSVAENTLLGAQPIGRLGIDWAKTRARALESLAQIDEAINPDVPVQELSKAQQQLVQVARAVATNARILIFDEPTAALTQRESDRLFAFIRQFRNEGGSVFYISHRLEEIVALSDRISVLRDGALVAELDPKTTNKDEMVRAMAGRTVDRRTATRRQPENEEVVLRVRGLTRPGEFRDVNFDLHRGAVLGIAGLVGSGRTELGRCLFGVTRAQAGTIEVFGRQRTLNHPAAAIAEGLVYLPEERKQDGIFPLLSIAENMGIATMEKWRGIFGLRFSDMVREVEDYVRRIPIKVGATSDPITSLSGGNQQKVILARWLMKKSRILILDEPTRGIDVNAKLEVQNLLRGLADQGLSIVFISSELQEVLDVSDRILVMHEGEVKGIENAADATQGIAALAGNELNVEEEMIDAAVPQPRGKDHGWAAPLIKFRNWDASGILVALTLLSVALAITAPTFLSQYNLSVVARQASFVGLIALGQTLVLLTGGIDLSLGAAAGLSAIVGALMLTALGLHPYLVLVLTALFGFGLGSINGFFTAWLRLNPFIVTLASWEIFAGTTLVITKGYPIRPLGEQFRIFGQGDIFGVPVPVVIFLAAGAILTFVLARTRFGRNIYAIGGNRDAATLVGIRVWRVEFIVFGLAGMFAALAGILYASRMDSAQPSVGEGWLMGAITAAIIGGTSLRGGQGTIIGTIFGALLMAVLANGIVLLNVSGYWERVIVGFVVLIAILVDLFRRK